MQKEVLIDKKAILRLIDLKVNKTKDRLELKFDK